ncbi:MAG TPA: hypothetical protein VKA73_12125 [Rubrobacter sp.]|nr:hypothetical protein [Rubrobacter sp.]
MADPPKNAYVVCGPTAGGKSGLADDLADILTADRGEWAPTIVVDSVQVYRGLASISNQARRRPAELVGVVPVTERWTVARHRRAAEAVISASISASGPTFVLDAGTGMYLNAVLLDVPLAPRVPEAVRKRAARESAGETNVRRSSRERELAMAGADERGSIWSGEPRYRTSLLYLRPERPALDRAIALRSRKIASEGLGEAEALREMVEAGEDVNPSVLEAVGVRELLDHLSGRLTIAQAEDRIATRTRQLARRQTRWFDKLARTLEGRATVAVAENPSDPRVLHTMHDTMGA